MKLNNTYLVPWLSLCYSSAILDSDNERPMVPEFSRSGSVYLSRSWTKHHFMSAYEGVAAELGLGTRLRCVVSFNLRKLFTRQKTPLAMSIEHEAGLREKTDEKFRSEKHPYSAP